MTDVLVKLPPSFRYLNQFAPSKWASNPSLMLCGETCAAMAAEFAYPGRYVPEQLIEELCVKFTGQPDVRSNPWGTTRGELDDWFKEVNIGHIDMSQLVDEFRAGNEAALHDEITAQNQQNVPQVIAVTDEAFLVEYGTGKNLHSWVNKDDPNHKVMGHVILRVGYGEEYGWYMEPAAPGFGHPVKIGWEDVKKAGIITCIAIMGAGVPTPPADFSYQHGIWPKPKPVFDLTKAENTIAAIQQALDAMKAAIGNLANDLSVLKEEV